MRRPRRRFAGLVLAVWAAMLLAVGAARSQELGALNVDGRGVDTKTNPACWPASGDDDAGDRFINCVDLTYLDTVTGLLWHTANLCASTSPLNWWDAMRRVREVVERNCLFDNSQWEDWRLATRADFEAILEPGCPSAPKIAGKAGGCHVDGNEWAFGIPHFFWTSTTDASDPSKAWAVNLTTGDLVSFDKDDDANFYVWAVRDAQ